MPTADTDVVLHYNDPFDNPAMPLLSTAQPGSLINNTLARQTPLKRGTKNWIGTGKSYWQNKRFSSVNNADVWVDGENSQPNRMKTETHRAMVLPPSGPPIEDEDTEFRETTVTIPDPAKQIIKVMEDCTPITKMECTVN